MKYKIETWTINFNEYNDLYYISGYYIDILLKENKVIYYPFRIEEKKLIIIDF